MTRYVILSALLLQGMFREPPGSEDPLPPNQQRGKDWTTRKELPLLRAKPLEPIKGHDHFDRKFGYLNYSRNDIGEDRRSCG